MKHKLSMYNQYSIQKNDYRFEAIFPDTRWKSVCDVYIFYLFIFIYLCRWVLLMLLMLSNLENIY